MKLKVDVSNSDIDPQNIFKLNLNLKSVNSRPLAEKLLSLDFENSYVLPIVNDKKNLYEILNEEYAELLNGNFSIEIEKIKYPAEIISKPLKQTNFKNN